MKDAFGSFLVAMAFWIAIVVVVSQSGCAGGMATGRDALSVAHEAGVMLREKVGPMIDELCGQAVDECRSSGQDADCLKLTRCDSARRAFGSGLKALQVGVKQVSGSLDELEAIGLVAGGAK